MWMLFLAWLHLTKINKFLKWTVSFQNAHVKTPARLHSSQKELSNAVKVSARGFRNWKLQKKRACTRVREMWEISGFQAGGMHADCVCCCCCCICFIPARFRFLKNFACDDSQKCCKFPCFSARWCILGLFFTAWHVEFLEPMHRGSYKARAKNNAAFVLFLHASCVARPCYRNLCSKAREESS